MDRSYQQLDTLIHQPARLSILAALAAVKEIEFATLKETINISDSLLSRYCSMLEAAGYIKIHKNFVVTTQPRTWFALTDTGRAALEQHIALLNKIANQTPPSSR